MTALVKRLDPCLNWFRLLIRTRGRILWIFPALLLAGYLVSLRGTSLLDNFRARSSARRANSPLLAEARGLNLGYEQVLAKPEDYAGKPVVWCVSTPAANASYVAGRPAWPVGLNGPFDEYRTSSGASGAYCLNVLAVITGFERGLIQLRPIEKL